jgi:hypothetical protein
LLAEEYSVPRTSIKGLVSVNPKMISSSDV